YSRLVLVGAEAEQRRNVADAIELRIIFDVEQLDVAPNRLWDDHVADVFDLSRLVATNRADAHPHARSFCIQPRGRGIGLQAGVSEPRPVQGSGERGGARWRHSRCGVPVRALRGSMRGGDYPASSPGPDWHDRGSAHWRSPRHPQKNAPGAVAVHKD